jgi:hypothetical protein
VCCSCRSLEEKAKGCGKCAIAATDVADRFEPLRAIYSQMAESLPAMNIARTIGLLGLCAAAAGCAGPASYLTGSGYLTNSTEPNQTVDMAYWTGHRTPTDDGRVTGADQASVPATYHAAARRQLKPLSSAGLARSDSNASIDAEKKASSGGAAPDAKGITGGKRGAAGTNWFTPDWYAREQAESERMKRLTNICRC